MISLTGLLSTMHRRPLVRGLAGLIVLQTLGCYKTTNWTIPAPALTNPLSLDYRGQAITLHRAFLEGDSVLVGWQPLGGGEPTVAHAGVARQEARPDSILVRLPLRGEAREIRLIQTSLAIVGGLFLLSGLEALVDFSSGVDFGPGG